MYVTVALVLLYSLYQVRTGDDQVLNVPKLCKVLFNSKTECPPPSYIKEDLICFGTSDRLSKSLEPALTNISNKTLKISDCQKWTRTVFSKFHGQKCLRITNRPAAASGHFPENSPSTMDPHKLGSRTAIQCSANQLPLLVADVVSKAVGNNTSALHTACEEGDIRTVRCILELGLEHINSRDKNGRTPVMLAAMNGRLEAFYFLLRHGCALSAIDVNGDNMLHAACRGGSVDILRKLLDGKMFDTEGKGEFGRSPVMTAAYYGHRKVYDFLRKKGSKIGVTDNQNNSVLHVACSGGHVDFVDYILSLGIFDIESQGKHLQTPVMIAAVEGHIEVVKLLVRVGCNLSAVDIHKNNMLHLACTGGHVRMVKYILNLKLVDIESKNYKGMTAVMLAALFGHTNVVKLLVIQGCSLKTADRYGRNILHVSCYGGHVDTVEFVYSQVPGYKESRESYGNTPLLVTVCSSHIEAFELLVNKKCNLTALDKLKRNMLHKVCITGNVDILHYILDHKLADIESKGYYGRTPIMTAVEFGQKSVVDILLSRGCNLKAVDDNHNNVLHLACSHGNADMLDYLLTLGDLDMQMRNTFGRTPLQIAMRKGYSKIVAILKSRK